MLALLALSFAATAPASAAGQVQWSVSGIKYGTPTLSALTCKAGTAGSWVEANGAGVENGATRLMSLTFAPPLATDTIHATMNAAGSRHLALVELRAADGVWHKVWEGKLAAPAPGFEEVCFEQRLPQKQVVQALRFTFRPAQDEVEVNHAALLRR
jgi:hypothetical protein